MPPKESKKAAARARTAAARAAQAKKRVAALRGDEESGGSSEPQVGLPNLAPVESPNDGEAEGGGVGGDEGGSQPPLPNDSSAGGAGEDEEDLESPPSPATQRRTQAALLAAIDREIAATNALIAAGEEEEEEREGDDEGRARTPEPAHRRDFECLRCVQSALHGDSSGWCVPASGSRTLKCQRCALGKTPCVTFVAGSELRRLVREFLAAKRGNSAPSVLSRATGALRSRIAFEQTLPQGDARRGTQKSGEVVSVPPTPERPSGALGGNAPVNPASSGGPASSTAVAVANEGQANAIRVAIDSLVGQSMPASAAPAYKILMDQYAAVLGGQRR